MPTAGTTFLSYRSASRPAALLRRRRHRSRAFPRDLPLHRRDSSSGAPLAERGGARARVRSRQPNAARGGSEMGRCVSRWTIGVAGSALLLAAASARAQDSKLPPVTVGAGVQTSYVHDAPEGSDASDRFLLNSVRLYVNGSATRKITFMFNTEYDGAGNHVTVLDAVAQVGVSDKVNFWFGRMLPPSDRANLYGPYYAHHWAVYTDGIQDGYPFVATGRDNGALYFGQFGKLRLEGGVYDGESATGNGDVISAGRAQYDFWDPEPGHYMNGTFYGDKNVLAVGGAIQGQSGNAAWNGDFLME